MRYNQRGFLNKIQYITAKIICQLSHIRNIEDIKFRIYFLYLCCLEVVQVDQLRAAVQDDEEKRDHILPIGKDGVSSVQLLRHEAWRQYLHPHAQSAVQAAKLPRGRGHGVH